MEKKIKALIESGDVQVKDGQWVGRKLPVYSVPRERALNGLITRHPARTDKNGVPLVRTVANRPDNIKGALANGFQICPVPATAPTGAKKSTTKKTESDEQ